MGENGTKVSVKEIPLFYFLPSLARELPQLGIPLPHCHGICKNPICMIRGVAGHVVACGQVI